MAVTKTEAHLAKKIRARIAESPIKPAMGFESGGKWRSISYAELGDRIDAVASWLIDEGVERGDRVAIFAANSPSWSIADLAIMSIGAITVPIYATNTAEQALHILRDAGAIIAFVGDAGQRDKILPLHSEGAVRRIAAFDPAAAAAGEGIHAFDALLAHPVSSLLAGRMEATDATDLAALIYTSGTTGEPKGVMLTHLNVSSQFETLDRKFDVSERDRSLCFLPLSHSYEHCWTLYVLAQGAENVYLEDPKRVAEVMKQVRPTCMVSVPRLYEKIYSTARHRLSQASEKKRALFEWALGVGREVGYRKVRKEKVGALLAAKHAVADKLVLSKVRDLVGGPKNFFSAGGAALSKEIEEFFFSTGLLVCQGYGLTETAPMLTCNAPGDFKFGTVGKPIVGVEIKIAPDGEILARGPNLMQGYYGMPEATAEAIVDGWFHTGDIGSFDEDGFLRITDRKKDLIITSGGKNIAPSRIESIIGADYYIDQIAAVGEGRNYISALIVPQFEALEEWAKENGVSSDSLKSMVKDPRVIAFFAERIEAQQKELAQYEKIKKFTLLSDRFSQIGGEITPTLKNIRKTIAQKYQEIIDSMYADDKDKTK
jgi:long-chain acyl-CoA synthetase